MNPAPKASIIIPAYNAEKYIVATLESIVDQSFTDWECIVIDDGSLDATATIVDCFPDSRVKLIRQPNSGGPAGPRNIGLSAARGEYIFIFDSDDIMLANKIQASVQALDKYLDAALLFTNFEEIDESGAVIKEDFLIGEFDYFHQYVKYDSDPVYISSDCLFDCLVRNNFIGTSSVVLRKSKLLATDVFNEELKNSDDRLFWFTLAKRCNGVFIPKKYHQYRKRGDSISGKGFIGRAESKIKALKMALLLCDVEQHKQCIRRQISRDYATYSFALRRQSKLKMAAQAAIKSFIEVPNVPALKHFLISVLSVFSVTKKRSIG